MFSIGPGELVVILGLALLIFGPKKMPEIGRSLGSAMRELRRASNDFMSVIDTPETDGARRDREDHEEHYDDFEHSRAEVDREEPDPVYVSEHNEQTDQTKEGE